MHEQNPSPAAFVTPPLIKRNITLFALSQSFNGAGMQLAYGIGPLMVLALTSSAALAGLSVALIGLSRFLVAYPVGRIMDAYGRKPAILLGLTLGLFGSMILALAMEIGNLFLMAGGMLVFAMGMNASHQLRIAATDMFPPQRRGQALGYIALGSLAGLVFLPPIMHFSETYAPSFGLQPLGLPWLIIPLMILPGMVLIKLVHPDPKEIGMNLERYYPDYVPPPKAVDEVPIPYSWRRAIRPLPIRVTPGSVGGDVRLHHPARLAVGSVWAHTGDVSRRGDHHGGGGAGHLSRGLLVGDAGHFSGWVRLGGGQCRDNGLYRRSFRNGRARADHWRQ
jgi:MFS family permease